MKLVGGTKLHMTLDFECVCVWYVQRNMMQYVSMVDAQLENCRPTPPIQRSLNLRVACRANSFNVRDMAC